MPDENGVRARASSGSVLLVAAVVLGVRGLGQRLVALADALSPSGSCLGPPPSSDGRAGRGRATGVVLARPRRLVFIGKRRAVRRRGAGPPGAVLAVLLLVVGPWGWRLAREREAERAARIRTEERAEMAARVHDWFSRRSHSSSARLATRAAWRHSRAGRSGAPHLALPRRDSVEGESLVASIEAAAVEIEELHGLRVEVVASGDTPLDERLGALVLATREAMANAARFSGAEEVSVYAEVTDGGATVFVRDRGAGFDRTACRRTARPGGVDRGTPRPPRRDGEDHERAGDGTEVELTPGEER